MNKIFFFPLLFIFLLIPTYYSSVFNDLHIPIDLHLYGNFEFPKALIFLFLISLSSIFFILTKKEILLNKYLIPLTGIFLIASVFALSPFTAFIGTNTKGQGFFFFFGLILLFLMLQNISEKQKKIIETSIIGTSFFVSILGILEFFFQTNSEGIAGRIVSTIGQTNNLALYMLLAVPFLINKIEKEKQYLYSIILVSVITCLLLSKGVIAIFILFGYIFFILTKRKYIYTIIFLLVGTIIGYFALLEIAPHKLHSFLARYYMWDSTIHIIFSDIKIFFLGAGSDHLKYYFSNFKSPYLYIYEVFGSSASNSHNIYLDIFFNFGIFTLLGSLYLSYTIYKKERSIYKDIFFLFIIFNLFNRTSITSYTICIFALAHLFGKKENWKLDNKLLIKILAVCYSTLVMFFAYSVYRGELFAYHKDYGKAIASFAHYDYYYRIGAYEYGKKIQGFSSETYYMSKINNRQDKVTICKEYIQKYKSAESYFYCGEKIGRIGDTKTSIEYYKKGLAMIPDIRNEDSPYREDYFIKHTISPEAILTTGYIFPKAVIKKLEQEDRP